MEKRINFFWVAGFFLPAINATFRSFDYTSTKVYKSYFIFDIIHDNLKYEITLLVFQIFKNWYHVKEYVRK